MLHYLSVGGPILWILFFISICSVAIIIERFMFFLSNERGVKKDFKLKINSLINENKISEAIELCDTNKSCISLSIKQFLKRTKKNLEVQDYETILKEIILEQTTPFEKRLHCMASIINISPMLGLLGTVTGMINAFTNISKFGSGNASIVADGIAEALLTTAAGLIIAIPMIVVYGYFNRKMEKIENEIDKIATNIINIFRRNYE